MSLILEALRRSEAERRRGVAPGLLDAAPPVRRAARPLWPIALAGLLAGLALAGAVAWWLVSRADGPSAGAPRAEAHGTSSTPPREVATREGSPPAIPSPGQDEERQTLAADAPQPASPAPIPSNPAPAIATLPPSAVSLPRASPADSPPAPPAAATGRPDDALDLAGLAPGQRAALPPLRVSMHVFADDPARRFAIIDGQRWREGDRLATDLQLVEIRRDGLRFDWSGRPLWLAR